jgi:pimeloyl-ACP methyl ester carboxylesterase
MSALPPVVLVHGVGSSFEHNWVVTGWIDVLADEGRTAVPFELPGHGGAARIPDDADDADVFVPFLEAQAEAAGGPVDVVGFSAGAQLSIRAATRRPSAIRRLALLGIGDGVLRPSEGFLTRLADLLDGAAEPADPHARVFWRLASSAGNDRAAVAAYLRRQLPPLTPDDLAGVELPVLLVLGERDFAGPGDGLVAALPDARLVPLRGVDHFGTTSDYRAMDAVSRFLAEAAG